jgi:23S rRNA pseudouridine2605 synthase
VDGERIAKRIARAGVCSRREAERLIEAGKVKVNGKKIISPALNVTPQDKISVDGKLLVDAEKTRLWIYHKPTGLVTTNRDPEGRPTVFDALPKEMPRVISIGRLDLNSEGLLLLTNDGALARKLELPETAWVRRYRVRAFGSFSADMLDRMQKPLTIDGIRYQPITIKMESASGANRWLMVSLKEGKNREIRKIFEHFGLKVNRLIRQSYGPFALGALRMGEVKEVPEKVLRSFVSN